MPDYKYLIIGGGMTGDAAVQGIREIDPSGTIGVIGSEPHLPYNRPPLSKALWKGKPLESIWRKSEQRGVTFHTGRTARDLQVQHKKVIDDGGTIYSYGKLLLATGSTPRRLPFGGGEIIYFRTLDDYHQLRELAEHGRRFAVIGGGFIGSELAAALAMNGKEVALIFPGESIGHRSFPRELAMFLNDYYRNKGVQVLAGAALAGMATEQGRRTLTIRRAQDDSTEVITVDGVVAGIGVQPNVELATAAGLTVDNGIRVNSTLQTSHAEIYAAGDVASFHNPALDQWLRVEHEDNANTMGRLAGQAMAGEAVSYDHLPSFYSDLFDLGYEAVGELDSQLETVADWKEPFREGVIYFLRNHRVRGVLLWNVWGQVDGARRLISERKQFAAADLKGRLPG